MAKLNVTGGPGAMYTAQARQTELPHTESLHRVFMAHTTSYLVQFRFDSIASQK